MGTYTQITPVPEIDLSTERLVIGDTGAHVEKMNRRADKLESWSSSLSQAIDEINILGQELESASQNGSDFIGTRKTVLIGNGVDHSFVIPHDFPDNLCNVRVFRAASPKVEVGVEVNYDVDGQITVGPFATAPLNNQFKVSIS